MSARFTDREASVVGRANVDARLDKYPGLRAKVEGMLAIVENAGGDVEKAAVAEPRVIDAIRELGRDRVAHAEAHAQMRRSDDSHCVTASCPRFFASSMERRASSRHSRRGWPAQRVVSRNEAD